MTTRVPSSDASKATKRTPLGDALLDHATQDSDRVQLLRYDRSAGVYNHAGSYEPGPVRAVGLSEFCRLRGGGGKYRARIKHTDGTYGPSTTLTVEGTPRTWGDDATSPATAAGAAAPGASMAETFGRFLGPFMAAAGTAIGSLLVKKLLEGPQLDPMVKLMFERSAGGGNVDPLEMMNAIAAAEARGETRGRELGKLTAQVENPPADGGAGGAIGAIDRGLPQVLEAVHRHLDIEERKVSPALTAGAGAAASTPAAPADPLVAILQGVPPMARKFLLGAAENGEPAEMYAQLVLGKLDDVTAARLPALLERADFGDVFVATYPAFAEYRPWVDEFVVALTEAAGADDDETDETDEPEGTPAAAT